MMTAIQSAAKAWEHRFLERVEALARQWVTLGREVCECQEKRYYEALGHASFEAWIKANKSRIGRARATILDARRMYRELSEHVQESDMAEISRANAKVLLQLPESGRKDAEMLGAAKTQSEHDFVATAKEKYGRWFVDDPKCNWYVPTVQSRRDLLEHLATEAMGKLGTESKGQAVEFALQHFMECEKSDD